jgi:hypothetical protein
VYIAKLGANGEPQLWHPTDTNKNNWVYWYTDTGLSGGADGRSYYGAVASNNRMYLLGGKTNSAAGGVTTVEVADIQPQGTLGSWSTAGMQALPYVLHSFTVHIYNDVMYLIGGNSNGTLKSDVYYSKLSSTGTMNSWTATSNFSSYGARSTLGGSFSTVWGAYIYVAGGCGTLTTGLCSALDSDTLLASINADGTLAEWNTINNLTSSRAGYNLIAWQGGLYRMGGCTSVTSGSCNTALSTVEYGVINQDGDASTVSNSEPSGTAPCSGGSPVNCDLPTAGDSAGQGGQMSSMVVINNGYIYNIGGCTNVSGTNECSGGNGMSGNISYAALNSDGNMASPGTCGGTSYGLWCVDSTNRINGTAGVGAASATVFNNTLYVIGGTDGTGTWTSNVYYVGLNANGSLSGAWTTAGTGTTGLPSVFPGIDNANTGIGYGYAFTRANPSSPGTTPGNLYYMGGCNGAGGIGCTNTNYSTGVYKCNISTAGAISGCTTSGQMQIDPDGTGTGFDGEGIGLMAGAIYANRLYLVGGACQVSTGAATDPCGSTYSANRKDTIYAKIDDSNNIVDSSTGLSTGQWRLTSGQMNPVRRRGVSFGYNGYIYSLAGYSGSASLQDLLFAKIDVSTGDMGNFSSSGVVVTPRWDLRAIVSNGYVYAIGGCGTGSAPSGCTALQPEIQTFQLYNNDSGTPMAYAATGTCGAGPCSGAGGVDRIGGSSTVLNGYIYYAGGCTNTGCTTMSNLTYYAPIDTNGNIGTWAAAASTLPASLAWGKLLTAGGTLYYVGGQTGSAATSAVSTVYYTSSISSGAPTWNGTAAAGGIGDTSGQAAQARTQFGGAVWNNRLYVVGGYSGAGAVQSTVYVSPQLNNGGAISADAWTSSTTFNVARAGLSTVAYANNLYLFGGEETGGNYLNDSQFTQINSDGSVDAWVYSTSLPGKIRNYL